MTDRVEKPQKKKLNMMIKQRGVTIGAFRGYNQACDDFEPYLAQQEEKIKALEKGLRLFESLTPQGSEFSGSPDTVYKYLKERLNSGRETKKDLVRS